MPRGSSSRSKPAPSPARSAPPAARAPPPAARAPAPAPAPAAAPSSGGGGMLSGLGATMAQGFAFGTGSAIAREAVGSVMGSFGSKDKEAAPAAAPAQQYNAPTGGVCEFDRQAFMNCLQSNSSNASNCDHYYNALQACQSRS